MRGNHRHYTTNETFVLWGAKTKFRVYFPFFRRFEREDCFCFSFLSLSLFLKTKTFINREKKRLERFCNFVCSILQPDTRLQSVESSPIFAFLDTCCTRTWLPLDMRDFISDFIQLISSMLLSLPAMRLTMFNKSDSTTIGVRPESSASLTLSKTAVA